MTRFTAFLLVFAACAAAPAPAPQAPVSSTPGRRPATQPAQAAPALAQPAAGPVPVQPQAQAAGPLSSKPFGGSGWGFVEASSANGRFVVLRRFPGHAKPTFGQHGEASTEPEVTLFDRVAEAERTIADIIDIDVTRRWLLLLADDALWLADAETGRLEALPGADMEPDGNACLPPRQATFSEKGKRVAWVAGQARELAVRDLATGAEWRITAKQRMWRGWPDDSGRGAVVIEVPAGTDWPQLRTSCACRWCNRFAMSYGVYGWGGPAFTTEHVDDSGSRQAHGDPPGSQGNWHGKTASGCELRPQSQDGALDRGPWAWHCPP